MGVTSNWPCRARNGAFYARQGLTELHNYHHVHPRCRSAMSMRCRAGTINAPTPSHRRLLPRANSCRALCPNSTSPTLRHRTSDTRPTFHPLPTHIPLLSRRTSHYFVISTLALSNSSHVSFHDVRTKTFFTHVTT